MASSSLNVEGQKKLRVMSLDYIKGSLIRKTSSKSMCGCSNNVDLNLDDDVEHISTEVDSDSVTVDNKNGTCKECGKRKVNHKSGLFKFLRKGLWWKTNNLGADSVNNRCISNNKVISDCTNSAFPSMISDFNKSKDNLNYNDCTDKPYCDVTTSEVLEVDKCNVNSVVVSNVSSDLTTIKEDSNNQEQQTNFHLDVETRIVENELPCSDNGIIKTQIVSNSNDIEIVNADISSDYQNSESVLSPPSPKARSLACELLKLSKYGWYWGPISREEAEEKLHDQPDGAFLVRDSSADHYLLSLSFKSSGKLLHTRIEHSQGLFSFYHQPEQERFATIGELIDHSVSFSQSAVFCYSRPRSPGHPAFPVRLTKPVSRFTQVRSLQYLCRFVIRQYITVDNIENLPLPKKIKGYIQEGHY